MAYSEEGFIAIMEGWSFLAQGEKTLARQQFNLAAALGMADGWIRLAMMAWDDGDKETASTYLLKAEAMAEADDVEANIACWRVHEIGVITSPEEHRRKELHFLRRAAELGDRRAQLAMAFHALRGGNGILKDEAQYDLWIGRALAQDDAEASVLCSHIETLLELKRPVPAELVERLRPAAEISPAAALLLSQVAPDFEISSVKVFDLAVLRDIGWRFWDPIGLLDEDGDWRNEPGFADEYDDYLLETAERLQRGDSEQDVVDYLTAIESDFMGLGFRPDARLRASDVAQRIKAYVEARRPSFQ